MKIIDIQCKGVSFPKPGSTTGETLEFMIPPGHQWVAVDRDGYVCAFRDKPKHNNAFWYDGSLSRKIGELPTNDCWLDGWDKMLIEVK